MTTHEAAAHARHLSRAVPNEPVRAREDGVPSASPHRWPKAPDEHRVVLLVWGLDRGEQSALARLLLPDLP